MEPYLLIQTYYQFALLKTIDMSPQMVTDTLDSHALPALHPPILY